MKPKNSNYQMTIYACFTGYVVQAIINNFVPLLFLTFQSSYGISLEKITILVTINFGIQLLVDLLAARYADRIGYRVLVVAAHVFAAAGFLLLTELPGVFDDPYTGILIAVIIYAVGGGLIEVLVSPIVESCPTQKKDAVMSLLHSFYCWGHVGVVLLSTLFFAVFGTHNWKYLAIFWAFIPALNAVLFSRVPIAALIDDERGALSFRQLFSRKLFWIMVFLMLCAGACEQAVSQWASTFAEAGLGLGKTIGDLAGPMMFAVMMGISRAVYGRISEKINLERFMLGSGILCLFSYLLIALSSSPVLALFGCALCGLSVGILWPGTFSLAAAGIPRGGTMMFAFFALAGDAGCSGGPTFVGMMSGIFGDNLNKGIMMAVIFPVLLLLGLWIRHRAERQNPS